MLKSTQNQWHIMTVRFMLFFLCLMLFYFFSHKWCEEDSETVLLNDVSIKDNLLKNSNFKEWNETGWPKEWVHDKQIHATKKISDESNSDFVCRLESKELGSYIRQCFLKKPDEKFFNSTITFGIWACTDKEPSCIKLAIHNDGTSDNLSNNVKTYNNVSWYWQFFTVSAKVVEYRSLEAYIFPDDGENGGSEGCIYVGGAVAVRGRLKTVEQ